MRTLAQISDLHFGRVDPCIADGLRSDLLRTPPSLLVISGDLTQRARPWQFRAARAFLNTLPQPQLVIPGNHDVPALNVLNRFVFPLKRYKRYISRDLRPVFADEFMLVMGINTARSLTRQGGIISDEKLLDLKLKCQDAPAEQYKVIVTHHPLMPAPAEVRTDLVKRYREALVAFENCGVDLLLSGHFHLSYSGDIRTHHTSVKRSMLSIHAGTATSTRVRENEPQGYNWIVLERDHVSVTMRTWDGQRFIDKITTGYTRVQGEWWRDEALSRTTPSGG